MYTVGSKILAIGFLLAEIMQNKVKYTTVVKYNQGILTFIDCG